MACFYKRGNMFWVSYRINGKLVQRTLHTDCRRIAKEKVRQMEYELSRSELQQVKALRPLKEAMKLAKDYRHFSVNMAETLREAIKSIESKQKK